MTKTSSFAALALCLSTGAALADTQFSEGTSSLALSRNIGETSCWVEQDCPTGETCHAALQIAGDTAKTLAELLKGKVDKDATFADWGLDIYVSKNNGLYCDLTDPANPLCTINFNTQTAELEAPLSCE